jgi:hypothetical protein
MENKVTYGMERFFLGLANGESFKAPNKDVANEIDESFRDDDPHTFFKNLYSQMTETFEAEDLKDKDLDEFIVEMGMITMLFIKQKIQQAKDEK